MCEVRRHIPEWKVNSRCAVSLFKHLLVWVSRALLCFQCSLQVTIRTTSELKHSHTRSPLPVSLSLSLFSLPVPPSGLGPRACFGVYCINTDNCMCAKLLQLCLTFCDPKDSSLPGSFLHGLLQARLPELLTMPSFRGSSQPRD